MTEQEMKKVQDEWKNFIDGKVSMKKQVDILKNIAINAMNKIDKLEKDIEQLKIKSYEKSISDSQNKKAE